MILPVFLYALWCALNLVAVTVASRLDPNVHIRAPDGLSEAEVVRALRQDIGRAALDKRDNKWKNSTTLDTSWDNAVILQLGGGGTVWKNGRAPISVNASIDIVCTTCYLKGVVTAELQVPNDFNVSQAISNVSAAVYSTVSNLTDAAVNFTEQYLCEIEAGSFEPPTFEVDLDLDIPPISDADITFTFDGVELYMLLDRALALGATQSIPLFRSEADWGLHYSDSSQLGLIFTVDLILAVEAAVDVSSGFHIKLDDGLAVNIALFGDEASGIVFSGGHFEFLPMYIENAGGVFAATLRVGAHVGASVDVVDIVGAGIEVGVFAHVAEFTTNITDHPGDQDCELGIVQSYQFALGAFAGATAGATIYDHAYSWGPAPTTTTPIFTRQLGSACATKVNRTVTAATDPTASTTAPRLTQNMTATTIFSTVTYTGYKCSSSGLVNCPASLQVTQVSTATNTLITVMPVGANVTWPASTQTTVSTTLPFGRDAVRMPSSSGTPASYVQPSPTSSTSSSTSPTGETTNGVPDRVIIGVSVGVGVPVLLILLGGLLFALNKRREHEVAPGFPEMVQPSSE